MGANKGKIKKDPKLNPEECHAQGDYLLMLISCLRSSYMRLTSKVYHILVTNKIPRVLETQETKQLRKGVHSQKVTHRSTGGDGCPGMSSYLTLSFTGWRVDDQGTPGRWSEPRRPGVCMRIESVAGMGLRQNGKMFGGCSIDETARGSSKERLQGDSRGKTRKCHQGIQGVRN